jgi:4-hydroxybenzoate polyprenyltransferase
MARIADPHPATAHTDIRATGWVARLPEDWRPFALLGRFDRPIGAWLLFLPGLWAILLGGASPSRIIWLVALFLVGSFVMRAAGCVVNDLWDRDMDRRVVRTAGRPLASGAITPRAALAFMAALALIGLLILLQLPPLAWALGVGSLALVVTYPLAKRVTWWPQLMLGFTFGWGAPMGAASTGMFASGAGTGAALWLYAASIIWIVGYDTIYAHQDREDDALVGIRSTARLFGRHSRLLVAGCYAATLVLLALAGLAAGLGTWFLPALALPALLLGWQVVRLDIDDPGRCLGLFKLNFPTGLAVALAILAGRL